MDPPVLDPPIGMPVLFFFFSDFLEYRLHVDLSPFVDLYDPHIRSEYAVQEKVAPCSFGRIRFLE
jgi:hypothetical protein